MDARLKTALKGMVLSFCWALLLPVAYLFVAPITAEYFWDVSFTAADLTYGMPTLYIFLLLVLICHWLPPILIGKGDIGNIASANICLCLSGVIFTFLLLVGTGSPPFGGSEIDDLCSLLGLPNTYEGYGFDIQTPCGTYLEQVRPLVAWGPVTAALVASAVLRIIISRSRANNARLPGQ